MKIQDQFSELKKLKEHINPVLEERNLQACLALAKELNENKIYAKLVGKDTQLYMLNHFFCIALREQSELIPRGIEANIFDNVSSLEELEAKYLAIEFAVLRMELDLEPEEVSETVRNLVALDASGIALLQVIRFETAEVKENIRKVSMELLKQGEILRVLVLLREAVSQLPEEDELKLMLANVWMEAGEPAEACKCLKEIKEPATEVVHLIEKLEGML